MACFNGHLRRKDPEKLRSALIEATARLIAENGLPRLTVDAVCRAAGVTKGGLFHHFPSKEHLVRGVLAALLAVADDTIDAMMSGDPEPQGRFTRAYLESVFADHKLGGGVSTRALCLAMLADPDLRDAWTAWRDGRVARHADTDDNPACALVRLAADGAWLNSLGDADRPTRLSAEVHDALIGLTRP